MNRLVLFILLLAGGAYAAFEHKQLILEFLGLGETPEQLRAVDLAKSSYSLDRHRNAYQFIRERLEESDEPVEKFGWEAEQKAGTVYLVTFLFAEGGRKDGYYFEVDLKTAKVVDVRSDRELMKRYGVPPAPR